MDELEVLTPAPIPIDWMTEEDEWRALLNEAIRRRRPFAGSGATLMHPSSGPPYFELTHHCDTPLTPARLYKLEQGVVLAIGRDAPLPDRTVWAEALHEATAQVGSQRKEIRWAGWIADHEGRSALDAGGRAAGVEWEPSAKAFQYAHFRETGFAGWGWDWFYPVQVRGLVNAFSWHEGAERAGRELFCLCALLAVLGGGHWRIVSQAFPIGDLTPDAPPRMHPLLEGHIVDTGGELYRKSVEVPNLAEAWTRFQNPNLSGPISSFMRGSRIASIDTPAAVVAFAAAIEGLGARGVPAQRCDCCSACTAKTGAMKSFRSALSTVLEPPLVKRLSKRLYTRRSGIAHGSLVDGDELTYANDFGGRMFEPSQRLELTRDMHLLQAAARRLLRSELLAEPPELLAAN